MVKMTYFKNSHVVWGDNVCILMFYNDGVFKKIDPEDEKDWISRVVNSLLQDKLDKEGRALCVKSSVVDTWTNCLVESILEDRDAKLPEGSGCWIPLKDESSCLPPNHVDAALPDEEAAAGLLSLPPERSTRGAACLHPGGAVSRGFGRARCYERPTRGIFAVRPSHHT